MLPFRSVPLLLNINYSNFLSRLITIISRSVCIIPVSSGDVFRPTKKRPVESVFRKSRYGNSTTRADIKGLFRTLALHRGGSAGQRHAGRGLQGPSRRPGLRREVVFPAVCDRPTKSKHPASHRRGQPFLTVYLAFRYGGSAERIGVWLSHASDPS